MKVFFSKNNHLGTEHSDEREDADSPAPHAGKAEHTPDLSGMKKGHLDPD